MIDADVAFAVGVVLLILALPAAVGALADGRPTGAAAILVVAGGGLLGPAI